MAAAMEAHVPLLLCRAGFLRAVDGDAGDTLANLPGGMVLPLSFCYALQSLLVF